MGNLLHWIAGEEVDAADFQEENVEVLDLIGRVSGIFFGSTAFQSTLNPVTATVTPGGVLIGGPGQICYVTSRQCSDLTPQNFPIVPNANSVPRVDLLCGRAKENDVNPFTRKVRNPDRTVSPAVTCYFTAHDIEWLPVRGNADGTRGLVPAGYDAIASITVSPNSSTASAAIILPSLASIIASLAVTSINGAKRDIVIECPDGSIQVTTNVGTGQIDLRAAASAASVGSLNTLVGNVTLSSPDGSVGIGVSGQDIVFHVAQAPSVSSVEGLAGNVTFVDGDGIHVDTSGGAIRITNTADMHFYGASFVSKARFQNSNNVDHPCALPALPGNNVYVLEATLFGFRLPFGDSYAALTAVVGSWDVSADATHSPGQCIVMIAGTCRGGTAPSVKANFHSIDEGMVGTIILRATAITGTL